MKTDLNKILSVFRRPASDFSLRRLWPWFLFVTLILVLLTFVSGVYFFKVFRNQSALLVSPADTRGPKADLKGLEEVIGIIEKREAEFDRLLQVPPLQDPSL